MEKELYVLLRYFARSEMDISLLKCRNQDFLRGADSIEISVV